MKRLAQKTTGSVILFLFAILFTASGTFAQSCPDNDIYFNSNTALNSLFICSGTSGNTISGPKVSGGPSYQWQVSTTGPTGSYSNVAGTGNAQNYTINTVYFSNTGTYNFRRVVSGASGGNAVCNGNSDIVELHVVTTGNWVGATSTDWNVASNWCGGVPTINTDIVISSGTVNQPTIGAAGGLCRNITLESGAVVTVSGANTLTVSGDWINNGGSLAAGSGTVIFSNTTGAQTIGGTSTARTFNNLTVNKSGQALTIGGSAISITVSGTLTVSAGTLNAGTASITAGSFTTAAAAVVDMGTQPLTVTTVSHAGLLKTQNTSATPITASKTWGGTVEYNAATQTVAPGTYNILNLTVAGTKTAGGTITVTTLDNGGASNVASVLNMAGNALNATSSDNTGATVRFSGASNGIALNTGTVDYYGSGQIVAAGNYATLIMSAAGTNFAGGAINVSSVLDNGGASNVAAVLDMALETLTAATIDNTGATIRFAGTGRAVSTGTVMYTGASQTVVTGSYQNLQIAQTSGTAALNGNCTVTGTLTLTSGNINSGAYKLSVSNTATGAVVRTSGHVIGDLERAIATGTNTYDFAVGTATGYTPTSITFSAATTGGNVTVKSADGVSGNYPAALHATKKLGRNWTISNSGVSGFTASANLNFLAGDLAGGATSPNLRAFKVSAGPVVTYLSASDFMVSGTTITYNNLTDFSEYGAGECKGTLAPAFTKTMASACGGGTDGSITVTPAGGTSPYTYSWTGTGGFTSTNAAITGLSSGDYTVVVSEVTKCASTIPDITIWQALTPVVTNSGSSSGSCGPSGSIILYGSYGVAPFTYSIDGVNYEPTNTFSSLAAGNYTGYVKDVRGCVGTKPNLVVAAISPVTISPFTRGATSCANNGTIEVYISGGISPYTYSVNGTNYFSSNTFSNMAGGTYTVWVKDGKGCVFSTTGVVVTKATAINVSSSKTNTSACANTGYIQLYGTGGVPPYTFKLNNGSYQQSGAFTGLAAGSYDGWVKDSKNCMNVQFSISIATDAASVINVTANPKNTGSCANNGSIQLFRSSGGTGPFTYSLDNITYQSSNIFNNKAAGTYTGWIKDVRGCTGSKTGIVIAQNSSLTSTASFTNTSTCVSNGTIQLRPSGGGGPYTYSLDDVTYQSSAHFTGLASGNYTGWVKSADGCKSSVNVNIGFNQINVTAYAGAASNCAASNGSIQLFRTGGIGPYTYSIDGVNFQSSPVFNGLTAGTYEGYVKDSKTCLGVNLNIEVGPECNQPFVNSNITKSALASNNLVTGNDKIKINVYPNPSASEFTLSLEKYYSGKITIQVFNVLGKTVYQTSGDGKQLYRFGYNLNPGIYFVKLFHNNSIQTVKLIKD